jgi:hypothetical protein
MDFGLLKRKKSTGAKSGEYGRLGGEHHLMFCEKIADQKGGMCQ